MFSHLVLGLRSAGLPASITEYLTLMAAMIPFIPAAAGETPKSGGTLTYLIAADAPPSFDAHREGTFATVYSAAPFYSVLIRVDPNTEVMS